MIQNTHCKQHNAKEYKNEICNLFFTERKFRHLTTIDFSCKNITFNGEIRKKRLTYQIKNPRKQVPC